MTLYEKAQPYIQSGDAITWEGRGLISWAIKHWSHRTHASLVVRPPHYKEFTDRRFLVEAWEGEVNMRLLSQRLEDYKGMAWWHQLRPELEPYRGVIGAYAVSQLGKKYDYTGLFANIFGRVSVDTRKYFCSELVGDAYRQNIPHKVYIEIPPNEALVRLLQGVALRPEGIAQLPIFKPEVRIL